MFCENKLEALKEVKMKKLIVGTLRNRRCLSALVMKPLISTFFTLLLFGFTGSSYGQVTQIERDALIALYNSTVGANWTDNTGWMGEVGTECDWYGVTCSSGSAQEISMPANNLIGSIPGLILIAAQLGLSAMMLASIRAHEHEIQLLRVIGAPP